MHSRKSSLQDYDFGGEPYNYRFASLLKVNCFKYNQLKARMNKIQNQDSMVNSCSLNM